jgi:hypothetical protein
MFLDPEEAARAEAKAKCDAAAMLRPDPNKVGPFISNWLYDRINSTNPVELSQMCVRITHTILAGREKEASEDRDMIFQLTCAFATL